MVVIKDKWRLITSIHFHYERLHPFLTPMIVRALNRIKSHSIDSKKKAAPCKATSKYHQTHRLLFKRTLSGSRFGFYHAKTGNK